MAPPPPLSNCFIPLVQRSEKDHTYEDEERDSFGLRPIQIQSNIVPSATSSALVQHGESRVLCTVMGPTTQVQHQQVPLDVEEGTLVVEVKYFLPPVHKLQTQSTTQRLERGGSSSNPQHTNRQHTQELQHMEQQLANQVLSAVRPILPLHTFPKSALVLRIDVWNDDGSLLTAALLAAVAALATCPGMELYSLVTACSVDVVVMNDDGGGKKSTWIVDPSHSSSSRTTTASVTLAVLPQHVCVWEQRGNVPKEALQACTEGCKRWQKLLRNYLVVQQDDDDHSKGKEL